MEGAASALCFFGEKWTADDPREVRHHYILLGHAHGIREGHPIDRCYECRRECSHSFSDNYGTHPQIMNPKAFPEGVKQIGKVTIGCQWNYQTSEFYLPAGE